MCYLPNWKNIFKAFFLWKKKKSLVTFFLDCVSEFSTACTSA